MNTVSWVIQPLHDGRLPLVAWRQQLVQNAVSPP
jgi:hypothetical protein